MPKNMDRLVKLNVFLEIHPEYKRALNVHPQTSAETLYNKASALGIHWSTKERMWYTDVRETIPVNLPPQATAQSAVNEPIYNTRRIASDLFLVRVMAHESKIAEAVSRLTELAEAVNLIVEEASKPVSNRGDSTWKRVYLKIRMMD